MSDYISRADAIEAVCRTRCGDKAKGCPAHSCLVIEEFDALPSAELPKGELISRADAIDAVAQEWLSEASAESPYVNDDDIGEYRKLAEELFEDVPSADADGEDLIIKGAKGIQDGLYNIKDGKLFKYKANGGTVRTYPIVPSADAVQGEWILHDGYYCSNCNHKLQTTGIPQYCPMCGARMKGGDSE